MRLSMTLIFPTSERTLNMNFVNEPLGVKEGSNYSDTTTNAFTGTENHGNVNFTSKKVPKFQLISVNNQFIKFCNMLR